MLCGGRIEQRIDNYVFAHSFLRKTQEFAFSLSLDRSINFQEHRASFAAEYIQSFWAPYWLGLKKFQYVVTVPYDRM